MAEVVMLANVFDANGVLLAINSTQNVAEAVALDLIGTNRARWVDPPEPNPATLTKEEVERVREGGAGTTTVGGVAYLVLPNGGLMPLAIMAGTPHESTVAGVVQQVVSLDHGSDGDHVEIMLTLNANTGDPDTPDTALASARFSAPDANAEVVKTGIIGASAGTVLAFHAPSGITMLHFGLRGAGPYTNAAANVLTALQMVVMKFAAALGVDTVEVRIGSATVGGGTNKRYRTITVTGYAS